MGAGIAEEMQQILTVAFLADIAHARRDPSRIEAELAGAGGAQEIEEFIGFCSGAHGLSFQSGFVAASTATAKWLPRAYASPGLCSGIGAQVVL
jgi:hypothetical protein